MDRYLDFTLGTDFATLPDMIKDVHAHDQRYVMIVVRSRSSRPVVAVRKCMTSGLVLTCRIRVLVARSQRARTGLMMKG